ncbi:MAG: radical SAM protein [Planctomycetota bacterium]
MNTVFMYEVSGRCNQSCSFCYNSWKGDGAPTKEQLDTRQALSLLDKVMDETGGCDITLSGGEPLMREDLFLLIDRIKKRGMKVILVSNGTLLTKETVGRCIAHGVDTFQLTLMSHKPRLHNRLAGIDGFEKVIDAVIEIRNQKGKVYTFFPALSDNIHTLKGAVELNVLLGVSDMAVGRFTPGGSGLSGWERLMPSPDALTTALDEADETAGRYAINLSISTPILPCLVDPRKYKRVRFGFCGVGNQERALFGIDPMGNLKACSHSPRILGNLLEEPLHRLIEHPFIHEMISTIPEFCKGCADLAICRGGCRSSAKVCYGSFREADPFLKLWKERARKPETPSFGLEGASRPSAC